MTPQEPKPTPTMEQAQRLYSALSAEPTRLARTVDEALKALTVPNATVLIELPWNEVRNGERHERHQVIATKVAGDRIYFINALKTPAKPGDVLGGRDKGPLRRHEENGQESMDLASFKRLYAQGGQAMLIP